MSIAERVAAPKTGRTSYGIVIEVNGVVLNEWGLQEPEAKDIHELLVLNGEQPLTEVPGWDGFTFSRRQVREQRQALAEFKAQLLAKQSASS